MRTGITGHISAPSSEPLDPSAMILLMQERFGWTERAPWYEIVARWKSRTAILYRCRGEGGHPDVVVKVMQRPDDGSAVAHTYDVMARFCGRLASVAPSGLRIPSPLGWSADPPSICGPFVEGTDLKLLLVGGAPLGELVHTVEGCGRVLGVFHSGFAPPTELQGRARDEAARSLRDAASGLFVGPSRLTAASERMEVALRYGDFAPYNFRVTSDGELCLLDAATAQVYEAVHRDVATFLFELRKLVREGGRGFGWRDRHERAATLRRAFQAGYATTGPAALASPGDQMLISLFDGRLAIGRARKRFRRRRFAEAAGYFARWSGATLRAWLVRSAMNSMEEEQG
jgi:hypothetical protein